MFLDHKLLPNDLWQYVRRASSTNGRVEEYKVLSGKPEGTRLIGSNRKIYPM
jgi:hypothetical protein